MNDPIVEEVRRVRGQHARELSHELTDDRPSVILDQVHNGVAIRMAVLYLLAGRRSQPARGGVV